MIYEDSTPIEIDTELAELYTKIQNASRYIPEFQKIVAQWETTKVRYSGTKEYYEGKLATMHAEVAALELLTLPGQAEFSKRRWSRFFICEHVHSSQHCHTLRPTSRIGWLPQLSGYNQTETVDALGEAACTVCFPDAPVNKPNTLELDPAKAERKAAAAARKEELAAKRAAAAITFADGSPVNDRYGHAYKNDRTVQIDAVDALATAISYQKAYPERVELIAEYTARFEYMLPALSFKAGRDMRAELTKKAEKKSW